VILDQLQSAIADRYKVERELGRGGMATVFLATDIRHEREVAIKVLHPDLAATIGAERFEREIKLAAKLQHPHILGLIDSGEANGLFYYVMPFIKGESVRDMLDRDKQLSVDEAIQITLEVADALSYAHAQNIVHRDIKPENVMMSNGHALVADFGIARARTEAGQSKLTQTGMAVGTPVYMSPEQATGEAVGPTADIYSLGCMLYEMLAGEPPFNGPNAMAIMARHAMEAVPSIRIIRPAVPEEVEEAIFAAMEKNVPDRPKTAAEFCDILGTPLGATATRRVTGRHTARMRVPTGARMPAYTTEELEAKLAPWWKRPMPLVAVGGGALVVLAAGYAAFSSFSGRNASAADSDLLAANKVAVMYFADNSGGKLAHIADGITETLIDQLKKVSALDVLSKDAVGRFRGKQPPVDSIADSLKAGTVVVGTVSEIGDRISVSFDIRDGNTTFSKKAMGLDLPESDLFNLNKTVVDSVAYYLRDVVGADIRTKELEAGTKSTAAIDHVQLAEKLRKDAVAAFAAGDSAKTWVNLTRADTALSNAEKEDARWAVPLARHALLSLTQSRAAKTPPLRQPFIDRGLAYADRALKLDDGNLDALEARGRLYRAKWDLPLEKTADVDKLLDSARADLELVTSRDGTRASAWVALSSVQAQLKEPSAAYISARTAYEQDAYLSGVEEVVRQLYSTRFDEQDFPKALEWCKDVGYRRFPKNWQFVSCQLTMRTTDAYNADIDSAWRELAKLDSILPANIKELQLRRHKMFVAITIAKNNLRDSAIAVIESARSRDKVIDPEGRLLTAEALARLRLKTPADTAEAFRLLQEYVVTQPRHGAGFLKTPHWWWEGLRRDKRWNDFLVMAAGK
jgi:eukaryotic-like serine/threonine-protein kinase